MEPGLRGADQRFRVAFRGHGRGPRGCMRRSPSSAGVLRQSFWSPGNVAYAVRVFGGGYAEDVMARMAA